VLIIDDEPSICKALSMALTRTGYEAIAAQSGEAALAVIREEHIVRPTRLRTLGSRKKFMHPRSSCPS
jgi:DNA-binding response OmpR family regulator